MRISKGVGLAAALVLASTMAGCGGSSSTSTPAPPGSSSGADTSNAPACEKSSGPVNLTFATWVPGMDKVVELWNNKNPDIQVKVRSGPSGNSGTYQNFFNEIKAGNPSDLGQVEYDALSSFRVADGLQDISGCEALKDAKAKFADFTWNQVTFGDEQGGTYAVPQDIGPIAMFYRKDLFDKAGIAVPTTWEEYAAAAAKIKSQGSFITNFPKSDVNWFAGMVWQKGGQWFDNSGDQWKVQLTSPQSLEVADYWQKLIATKEVSQLASFSDEWNNSFETGKQWTWVSAVWGASTLRDGAPGTAGKWAVAPMPQWSGGDKAAGNWGGSSTAVFKGSKHPYEAAQFAMWLNTDPEALALENKLGGLYPAAKGGADLPVFSEPQPFYGGQKIYDEFATAAKQVKPDFTFGPTMTQTYTDVSDGFGAALGGQSTVQDALKAGQEKTIAALKAQAIPVSG